MLTTVVSYMLKILANVGQTDTEQPTDRQTNLLIEDFVKS